MTKKKPKKIVKKIKKVKSKSKPKTKTLIIPSPVDANVKVMIASELADDSIIEQELAGKVLPYYVYRFNQEGKEVVGMTVKGVNEVVRRLNKNPKSGSKIHINPQYITKEEVEREGEKGIEVSVFAEDLISGNSGWGIKFEPYFKQGRNGRYKNTFAIEKALSKAERNAKRKLISEDAAIAMIDKLIKENPNNVKQIEAPQFIQTTVKPLKPVASSPEELLKMTLGVINRSEDVSELKNILKRSKESNMPQNLKDEINKAVNGRLDKIIVG